MSDVAGGRRVIGLIQPEDVEDRLGPLHREAMLDLILAWASLDGALGMMLARVLGIPTMEAAEFVERMSATARLAEMRRALLRSSIGAEAARTLAKHKRSYERLAPIRNMVAHSHCAGFWTKNPDHVVFMTFKKVGDEELAIDALSIHLMLHATAWAKAMRKLAFEISKVPYQPPVEAGD